MIRTQRNNLLQIRVQRKNMACIQADANNTRTAQELYLDPSARISIRRHTRTAQEFRSEHLKDFLSLLSQHLTCEAQTSVLWILA